MSSRKKEITFIIGLIAILGIAYLGIRIVSNKNAENITKIQVRYKDKTLQELSFEKPGTYEFEVDLGHLYVEVENDRYRVIDVDCPDKICESEGWIEKGSERLIVCLPNNVVIIQS